MKTLGKRVTHPFRVIKNLQEPIIIGANFMNWHLLAYNPRQKRVFWQDDDDWDNGVALLQCATVVPPFSSRLVQASLKTEKFKEPVNGQQVMVNVISEDEPLIQGPPALVCNKNGKINMEICNCGPETIFLE
jgi:hypothetical protein